MVSEWRRLTISRCIGDPWVDPTDRTPPLIMFLINHRVSSRAKFTRPRSLLGLITRVEETGDKVHAPSPCKPSGRLPPRYFLASSPHLLSSRRGYRNNPSRGGVVRGVNDPETVCASWVKIRARSENFERERENKEGAATTSLTARR